MNFERVKREEADTVLKLYRSLLGTPYCVWTEEYPSEKEVEFDLSRDALFCMRDEKGLTWFRADHCVYRMEVASTVRLRRGITYTFNTYYTYQ